MDYDAFLGRKRHEGGDDGFAPVWLPDFLFDFQASVVEWERAAQQPPLL